MKRYFAPTALGFLGMFAAHFILFLLSMTLLFQFMPYIIAYPLVYVSLVYLLTKNQPAWWLSNTICILLIPTIYWYWLLWTDGKLHLVDAVKIGDDSGMSLIIPLTLVLVLITAQSIHTRSRLAPNGKTF